MTIQERPYHLKKTRLSTYQPEFARLKTEFLKYKWNMELYIEGKGTLRIRKRMEKVSRLLFEIEQEFRKHRD